MESRGNKREIINMISDSAWASVIIAVPYIGTIVDKIISGKKIRKIEEEIIKLSVKVDKLIEEKNPSLRSTEAYNSIMKIAASNPTKDIPDEYISELIDYLINYDCNLVEKAEISGYINMMDFNCFNQIKEIAEKFTKKFTISNHNHPEGSYINLKLDGYIDRKIDIKYDKVKITETEANEVFPKYDLSANFLAKDWEKAIKLRLMYTNNATYVGVLVSEKYAHPNPIFVFFIKFFNNEMRN